MSHSRTSIARILEHEFKTPGNKEKICAPAIKTLEQNPKFAQRIFDRFPCLLSQKVIGAYVQKFQDILIEMNPDELIYTPDGIRVSKNDSEKITDFKNTLITMAMTELLDDTGHLRNEIIVLLEWKKFQLQLSDMPLLVSILSSYVNAICQEITLKSSVLINESGKAAYAGFCSVFNHDLQTSILNEYNKHNFPITKATKTKQNSSQLNKPFVPIEKHTLGSKMLLLSITKATNVRFFMNSPQKLIIELNPDEKAFDAKL